ncbi:MAG: M48 family metalloprotease [Rhodobacteraceae bacterium]|nr:M48 family metalloprotease [Paracoccaceae bacterium]
MIRASAAALCLALAACGTAYQVPVTGSPAATAAPAPEAPAGARRSARDFRRVAARIEPVAENVCREESPGAPSAYCDYVILLEDDPRMPPNALQTVTDAGRPAIVVGARLLDQMQSNDEIAFVLSHEASHHIARHLSKQQQSQMLGALILGGLVAATGASSDPAANQRAIEDAMNIGAFVGGRAWSQDFELEADWLGAFIAARAGFDPERGAAVFARPALASSGGPVILSTHPPSPQRTALAARAGAEIRRQQAAGLVPRPAYAESQF